MMRVSGNNFTEKVYAYYQQNQLGKDTRGITWQGMLSQVSEGFISSPENPALQILSDYQAWKAQQPPRQLPGSQGATEENKAYLRAHFSGKLDLFQRLDAADTMVEMGILSRDQMLESLGLGDFQLRCIRMDGPAIVCNGPVGRDQRFDPWTNFFSAAPMMRANTLGQLLDVLDSGLKFFSKKDGAAEEVRAVLSQLTMRVPA